MQTTQPASPPHRGVLDVRLRDGYCGQEKDNEEPIMANASNNDRFGGRFLIQDTNHMSDIPEEGGRFMIQDHDHLSGMTQANAGNDQSQSNERQQGGEDQGKKSKKRPGRQFL